MSDTETLERPPTRDREPGELPDVDAIQGTSDIEATVPSVTTAAVVDATEPPVPRGRRQVQFGEITVCAKSGHPPCNGRGFTYEHNPKDKDKPVKKLCRCAAVRFMREHPEVEVDQDKQAWWPAAAVSAAADQLIDAVAVEAPAPAAKPDRERRLEHIKNLEERKAALDVEIDKVEHEIIGLIKDDVDKKNALETDLERGAGYAITALNQANMDDQDALANIDLKIEEFNALKLKILHDIDVRTAGKPELIERARPIREAIEQLEESIKEKVGRTRKHQNRLRAKAEALDNQIARLKLRNS